MKNFLVLLMLVLASASFAQSGTKKVIGNQPMQNYIINGNFDFWQRGVSFSTYTYTADRWFADFGGSGPTMVVSQQTFTIGQTDVPDEPKYFLRYVVSSLGSSSAHRIEQRIESVRSLVGKTATLSFYVKSSAAITVTPQAYQSFGTGGSPSSAVYVNMTGCSVTTSWSKCTKTFTVPSIAGKTLGTNNNDYLGIRMIMPDSAFTVDFAHVMLNEGPVAAPFRLAGGTIGGELALAQRYYEMSYDFGWTVRGTSTNIYNGNGAQSVTSVGTLAAHVPFRVMKRVAPTVVTLWDSSGNGGVSPGASKCNRPSFEVQDNLNSTCSASTTTHSMVVRSYTGNAGSGLVFHWTADAEL